MAFDLPSNISCISHFQNISKDTIRLKASSIEYPLEHTKFYPANCITTMIISLQSVLLAPIVVLESRINFFVTGFNCWIIGDPPVNCNAILIKNEY